MRTSGAAAAQGSTQLVFLPGRPPTRRRGAVAVDDGDDDDGEGPLESAPPQ